MNGLLLNTNKTEVIHTLTTQHTKKGKECGYSYQCSRVKSLNVSKSSEAAENHSGTGFSFTAYIIVHHERQRSKHHYSKSVSLITFGCRYLRKWLSLASCLVSYHLDCTNSLFTGMRVHARSRNYIIEKQDHISCILRWLYCFRYANTFQLHTTALLTNKIGQFGEQ